MAQQIRLIGWHDAATPGLVRADGAYDFRLTLSEEPSPAWRKVYSEPDRNQTPTEILDRNVLLATCALNEIESTVERIRSRLDLANERLARHEQELLERIALHKRVEDEERQKVLAAVSRIRFDEAPRAGSQ